MALSTHNQAVIAVGYLDTSAEHMAVAVDALSAIGGFEAADVALQLQAARVALLSAQNKARRLLARSSSSQVTR
jgi:hypothetical protein